MEQLNTSETARQQPPMPDPELQRLAPLVGTWKTSSHTQDSLLGPGVPVDSTETFAWHEGGYFLVSTWVTVFGREPAQKGVMYWGYDRPSATFRTHFFDNQGPFHAGSMYQGVVEGTTLTFEGPARFQYELDKGGRISVNADDTITVAWWLRDQYGVWAPWMINTFARLD